ncbi:MAG: polymer-forming cytoskeletal protein, partial [Nitrospirae bacterium]|nr:polymer-forming cytoskeletal protein [Nitrospirota bacterium]
MFSMFSKNTEKLESFIGINSHFKGDIKTQGTLRIDGTVEGNIETDWLILGETSHLKGDA